jgi:hypothetical protein
MLLRIVTCLVPSQIIEELGLFRGEGCVSEDDKPVEGGVKLKRRLVVLRLATVGGAGLTTSACGPEVVTVGAQVIGAMAQGAAGAGGGPSMAGRTGVSDADPSDPPGRGRGGHRGSGVTDSDPSDQPGFGRGGARRTAGISDSDPSDPAGQGRGGSRPAQRTTGISDADPSDAPGQGRGGARPVAVRTGLTDSDPSDSPGFGRRGR